ncbi:ATP-binding protein [Pannonibacter sp. Pt2-lr]
MFGIRVTASPRRSAGPYAAVRTGNAARAGEGTGLGLAIVHQIAKAHEGGVEFEQNEGSFTVRIRIPQAAVA